jgi:proteasome lid subunit RPN8/RPN11
VQHAVFVLNARKARQTVPAKNQTIEQCWTLVGQRRGRIWYCRRVRRTSGTRSTVGFDGSWVLEREESFGDVVGFLHTHPDGPESPSARDVRTMHAWCNSFGKPLLCVIASPQGTIGYCFSGPTSNSQRLSYMECFPRGVLIGVSADGE